MKTIFSAVCIALCICQSVSAQNEVLRQINSLRGITSFGISINVEHPSSLNDFDFDLSGIRKEIQDKLEAASVSVIGDDELRSSDQYPLLSLHINVLRAGNGTYPYSVELAFYQPVKLTLNRDVGTVAATWQTSFVAIVSHDLLEHITPSAINLVDSFVNDFASVNL